MQERHEWRKRFYEENLWTDYAFLSIQETRWCRPREMGSIFTPFQVNVKLCLLESDPSPVNEFGWKATQRTILLFFITWYEQCFRFLSINAWISDDAHTVIYKMGFGCIQWETFELTLRSDFDWNSSETLVLKIKVLKRFFKWCHRRNIFGSTKNHSVKGSLKNHLFLTFI